MDEKTIIDLTKPADLIMVNRAVCNGWDVHQNVRDQITDQLGAAMDHYWNIYAKGGRAQKQINQLLKLGKLMIAMEGRNMVEEGRANQSQFSYLRKRPYPERPRKPRINRQQIRVQAALARKSAREAQNSGGVA